CAAKYDQPTPGSSSGNPVDRLVAAWVRWEKAPGAAHTARGKVDAIHACGLGVARAHEAIAAARRDGLSVPDAVQAVVNDAVGEAA
ncbi:MAG: hypothetical protein GWN08_08525, partial [Gemmatimonadetes bacterium]|nr:hypothetical protein [Gemmatimonadota bacterium]